LKPLECNAGNICFGFSRGVSATEQAIPINLPKKVPGKRSLTAAQPRIPGIELAIRPKMDVSGNGVSHAPDRSAFGPVNLS
jgi:hypothetical protein